MTGRATFGDFAQVARARLDEAIADDERAERPWKAAALARQGREPPGRWDRPGLSSVLSLSF